MGYDMYVKNDENLPLTEEETDYLRFNIWGMPYFRSWLASFGAAFDISEYGMTAPNGWVGTSGEGELAWPDPADFGLTQNEVWNGESELEDQVKRDAHKRFMEATDKVLSCHGPGDVPGIPLHKLSDNSGWHVTPGECKGVLLLWERSSKPLIPFEDDDEESTRERTEESLRFFKTAARLGGFHVC